MKDFNHYYAELVGVINDLLHMGWVGWTIIALLVMVAVIVTWMVCGAIAERVDTAFIEPQISAVRVVGKYIEGADWLLFRDEEYYVKVMLGYDEFEIQIDPSFYGVIYAGDHFNIEWGIGRISGQVHIFKVYAHRLALAT